MRARDLPKLHGEDPSGFWKLIRTGKELPVLGQQILFIYDIRGTTAELQHQLFVKIAAGDAYRITNENPSKLPPGARELHAEFLKLPTSQAVPRTLAGYVEELGFDEILQDHWIAVKYEHSRTSFDPTHIVYWAPLPVPFDGYIPRTDDLADLYYTEGLIKNELLTLDCT